MHVKAKGPKSGVILKRQPSIYLGVWCGSFLWDFAAVFLGKVFHWDLEASWLRDADWPASTRDLLASASEHQSYECTASPPLSLPRHLSAFPWRSGFQTQVLMLTWHEPSAQPQIVFPMTLTACCWEDLVGSSS